MNRTQLESLAAELASPLYTGKSYEECAALLNYQASTTEPNPEPQTDVPKPFDINDIVAAVSVHDAPGMVALYERFPTLVPDVKQVIGNNDMRGLTTYLGFIQASGVLNAAAIQAIQEVITQTIPDPTWSAVVTVATPSRADELGLLFVTPEHVQAALHLETV